MTLNYRAAYTALPISVELTYTKGEIFEAIVLFKRTFKILTVIFKQLKK